MPNDQTGSCAGKKKIASAGLAQKVVKRSRHLGRRHAYRCEHCGFWHLGTPERTVDFNPGLRAKRARYYEVEASDD